MWHIEASGRMKQDTTQESEQHVHTSWHSHSLTHSLPPYITTNCLLTQTESSSLRGYWNLCDGWRRAKWDKEVFRTDGRGGEESPRHTIYHHQKNNKARGRTSDWDNVASCYRWISKFQKYEWMNGWISMCFLKLLGTTWSLYLMSFEYLPMYGVTTIVCTYLGNTFTRPQIYSTSIPPSPLLPNQSSILHNWSDPSSMQHKAPRSQGVWLKRHEPQRGWPERIPSASIDVPRSRRKDSHFTSHYQLSSNLHGRWDSEGAVLRMRLDPIILFLMLWNKTPGKALFTRGSTLRTFGFNTPSASTGVAILLQRHITSLFICEFATTDIHSGKESLIKESWPVDYAVNMHAIFSSTAGCRDIVYSLPPPFPIFEWESDRSFSLRVHRSISQPPCLAKPQRRSVGI